MMGDVMRNILTVLLIFAVFTSCGKKEIVPLETTAQIAEQTEGIVLHDDDFIPDESELPFNEDDERFQHFTTVMRIHEELPAFTFTRTVGNEVIFDGANAVNITVSQNGNIIQEFHDLYQYEMREDDDEIFFNDYNGDGYLDMALRIAYGGTMGNSPCYFWLWDTETAQYVLNEQLTEWSDGRTVTLLEPGIVRTSVRGGPGLHSFSICVFQDGEFITVISENIETDLTDYDYYTITVTEHITGTQSVNRRRSGYSPTENIEEIFALYESVLRNEIQFLYHGEDSMYLNHLLEDLGSDYEIAVIDLDGDGIPEVIINVLPEYHRIILTYYNGEIYVAWRSIREMSGITTDGTFFGAGGLGHYRILRMNINNGIFQDEEIMNVGFSSIREDEYFINGEAVTEEKYRLLEKALWAWRNGKEHLTWHSVTENLINLWRN